MQTHAPQAARMPPPVLFSPALSPEQRPGLAVSPQPAATPPAPPSSPEHPSYMGLTLLWLNSESDSHP